MSKVERSGVLSENLFLNFSQERLAQYKLTPSDLPDLLAARNLPDSGQTLNAQGRTISVSTTASSRASRRPAECDDRDVAERIPALPA